MAEKTVGEILKEQGVIPRDAPKREEGEQEQKMSFFGDMKTRQLMMDIEKLKAQVEGLRDVKFTSDERIKELAENIGEIRSIVFQKDSLVKEIESKLKLMQDSINDIEPRKIEKTLNKQDEEIHLFEAKVEKVESMYKDVYKKFEDAQRILEGIKSVENLQTKVGQMEDILSKSIENKAQVDRMASKTEKIYSEIENKIKDIEKLKSDSEKIDDLTKELNKSIDQINLKTEGFAKIEDIEEFKNTINDLLVSNKEQIERKFKEIDESLNIPTEEITQKIEEAQRKREGILNLINSLEEQYRSGAVKKDTFDEVRSKNEAMIAKLDEELGRLEGQKGLSMSSLPNVINSIQESIRSVEEKTERTEQQMEPMINLESRIYVLESGMERIKSSIREVDPERLARMTNAIDIQTEIVNDILSKLKEVNRRLMESKVNVNDYENRTRLFEVLNIIVRLKTTEEIHSYLLELEKLIFKLRLDKLWNSEKQKLTENLMMELSEGWNEQGRNDVAKLFRDFLEKLNAIEKRG